MSDNSMQAIRGITVPDAKLMVGSFTYTSGDPAASSYLGFNISSVTYAATGKFTVTFTNADVMTSVVYAHAEVKDITDGSTPPGPNTSMTKAAWATCYYDATATGGPTLSIYTRRVDTGDLVAPDSGTVITFFLVATGSGVGYGYA